jgi:hypothetical protein
MVWEPFLDDFEVEQAEKAAAKAKADPKKLGVAIEAVSNIQNRICSFFVPFALWPC